MSSDGCEGRVATSRHLLQPPRPAVAASALAVLVSIALVALAIAYRWLQDPQVACMILAVAAAFCMLLILLLNDRTKDGATGLLRLVGLTRFQSS